MSTPNSMTPRAVHAALLQRIGARQFDTIAELYAVDTVVDLPLAIPSPRRMTGREELRQHFSNAANAPLTIQVGDSVVYDTTDPEVIVAEFVYTAHIKTNGRAVKISNVQIMRVRDGEIVWSRDYHDHAAIAAAMSAQTVPQAPPR